MLDIETERRRFSRHHHNIKALINFDGNWETAKCKDISGGGIRFLTDQRPALNKDIQIHLDSFGRFEGSVQRHTDDGFAVRLIASEFIMKQLAEQLESDDLISQK